MQNAIVSSKNRSFTAVRASLLCPLTAGKRATGFAMTTKTQRGASPAATKPRRAGLASAKSLSLKKTRHYNFYGGGKPPLQNSATVRGHETSERDGLKPAPTG